MIFNKLKIKTDLGPQNIVRTKAKPMLVCGFTILELLVVISIIGVLSSVVMTMFGSTKLKSRDARRVSDMVQIQNGLNLYFTDHSIFPIFTSETTITGTDAFSSMLTSGDYMISVPTDPSPGYSYKYISNSSGTDYQISFCMEGDSIPRYEVGCDNTVAP